MASKTHQKHADLAKPDLGFFGRNEWAFLGAACGNIRQLASRLSAALSPDWKTAFVDADHKGAEEEKAQGRDAKTLLAHGAKLEYTDKITFHRFDLEEKMDTYQYRPMFNNMDMVLVNGNHFTAKKQVVIIDPQKEDSLKRKLDRLTDVQLILLGDGVNGVPGFLKEHLAGVGQTKTIPCLQLADFQKIETFFKKQMAAAAPPIAGLVLSGGKSLRMGYDKGMLEYYGKPQREHMADLVELLCQKTFISCRTDQVDVLMGEHFVLFDSVLNLGPFGAILSAFRSQPDSAWLVVACDLPLLDEKTLRYLVENRNPSAIATAFRSPVNEFPEPLVAIWEPKAYPVLLQFMAQGYSCPRKVLINSPVHLLDAPNPDALRNVNTPGELEEVMKLIAG